jgi:hypothetical protein
LSQLLRAPAVRPTCRPRGLTGTSEATVDRSAKPGRSRAREARHQMGKCALDTCVGQVWLGSQARTKHATCPAPLDVRHGGFTCPVIQLVPRRPRRPTGMVVRLWRQASPAGIPSARLRCGVRRSRPGRRGSARGGSVSLCCPASPAVSRHHLRCCRRRCRRLSRAA